MSSEPNNPLPPPPVLPKDGQLIALIMKSMDILECEPQVIPQMLEFMYRHATETIQDALLYAEHAGRAEVTLNDLRFAIQSRASHSFISPPARELLVEIATRKNAEPLPLLSDDRYIRLPPDEYCLFGQQSQITALPMLKSSHGLPSSTAPTKMAFSSGA